MIDCWCQVWSYWWHSELSQCRTGAVIPLVSRGEGGVHLHYCEQIHDWKIKIKKKWGTKNHHFLIYYSRESLNFDASFTHSPFPIFRWGYITIYYWMKLSMMWRIMQIKENVIHWGQWRARWITASYIETVKYFERIIMGLTSCICARIGRRKIKGRYHWHVLVVISIFLFGKLFKKCFWKTAVVPPIGHKLLVPYQGLNHLHCLRRQFVSLWPLQRDK